MSLLSAAFLRRGAIPLLLLLGTKNAVHAFVSPATIGGVRRSCALATSSVSLRVTPLRRNDSAPLTSSSKNGRRSAASAMAKRVVKGLATRALRTIPPALVAGSCVVGAFPRSALAFTTSDYVAHAMSNPARNLIGAGIVAATSAQVLRVAKNPPADGVALAAAASLSTDATAAAEEAKRPTKIPITVLSGFLGAGKTTALKRLLENTEGIKVGTIVNDMASVNIDAKLISNPMNGDGKNMNAVGKGSSGTVELQNGCACCSLSDELLTSISDLMEGRDLDAIVVELSGVADPASVRTNWKQAVSTNHPATEKAELGRVVTVVDSHTFGTDWMTWDTAGKRDWAGKDDACAAARQVPELLAEQVEAADVIILNKIDLSQGEQLETATLVVRGLNKDAELIETKFGEMTPDKILGNVAKSLKEVDEGHDHGHDHSCSEPDCADVSHSHSHSHEDHSSEAACAEPDCSDPSHSHSHSHSPEACADPDCNDTSHSHSHSHSSEGACADPDCSDVSHSHSHSHSSEGACADPECNDTSHSHSHDHKATSTDSLGISNFVYKSSRPFDPRKLQRLLMTWPIPVMEELKLAELSKELEEAEEKDLQEKSPFVGVLRSKGFAWVAPSILSGAFNDLERHDIAMYWSHAGKHFGLKEAGTWWASMGRDAMKKVFEGNLEEYERIIREDFVSGEWGDRRQEIVFIGAKLDEKGIRDALDSCLCTDEQIGEYKQAILDAIAEYYAQ